MKNNGNPLYLLVRSAIQDLTCQQHDEQLTRYKDSKLLCQRCKDFHVAQPIHEYFDRPLLSLVEHYSPAAIANKDILQPCFLTSIHKNIHQSEKAMCSFLDCLEKSVQTQCRFLKQSYENMSRSSINFIEENIQYLENINKIYMDYFEEQVNSTTLNSPKDLVNLIDGFIAGSQNPTNSLLQKLETTKKAAVSFPYLKMEALKSLYVETCDPFRWKVSNFVKNSLVEDEPLMDPTLVKLLDRQHMVKFDSQRIEIMDLSSKVVSTIYNGADDCFEIEKFRLVTADNQNISVYSYLDPYNPHNLLSIQAKYPINVSYNQGFLYFLSEGRLQRYELDTGIKSQLLPGKVVDFKLKSDRVLVAQQKLFWTVWLNNLERENISGEAYNR